MSTRKEVEQALADLREDCASGRIPSEEALKTILDWVEARLMDDESERRE